MAPDPGDTPPPTADDSVNIDPIAVLAILCGIAGIFVAKLVLVPLTLLLAAIAGGRARFGRGDIGWAYVAFGIGAVDGMLLLFSLVFNGSAPPKVPKP
jgi:hypothetical protein